MAMNSSLRGRTMLKRRSMYFMISTMMSSSVGGASFPGCYCDAGVASCACAYLIFRMGTRVYDAVHV